MAQTDWIAAVKKIKGYVDTYLAIENPTARQKAALQTDLATLDKDLAALSASLQAAPAVTPDVPKAPAREYTPDEIWALFLDAEDAALKAKGRPYGRDGAERGGMSRGEHVALVEGLGIPNALAILKSGGYSFGELDPSISQ